MLWMVLGAGLSVAPIIGFPLIQEIFTDYDVNWRELLSSGEILIASVALLGSGLCFVLDSTVLKKIPVVASVAAAITFFVAVAYTYGYAVVSSSPPGASADVDSMLWAFGGSIFICTCLLAIAENARLITFPSAVGEPTRAGGVVDIRDDSRGSRVQP